MPPKNNNSIRLSKVAKEFNVGIDTTVEFLAKKGYQIDKSPNTKLTADMYAILSKEYQGEKDVVIKAKKMRNLSYRGGSVSIETTIEKSTNTVPLSEAEKKRKKEATEAKKKEKKETQKINESKKEKTTTNPIVNHKVKFSELKFHQGHVSITYKKRSYVYEDHRIKDYDKIILRTYAVSSIAKKRAIKNTIIKVEINTKTKTFVFKDLDIHEHINKLKGSILATKDQYITQLSKAAKEFDVELETIVSFLSKKGFIITPLPNTMLTVEMYGLLLKEYQKKKKRRLNQVASEFNMSKNAIVDFLEKKGFIINPSPRTIITDEMYGLLVDLSSTLKTMKDNMSQKQPLKTMAIEAANIRFFDGYYLIFQTSNGGFDNSITPYRVNDPNSKEILNLVHNYFEKRLEEMHIIVKLDDKKTIELSKPDQLQLSRYVQILKRKLIEKGEWWEKTKKNNKPSQSRNTQTNVVPQRILLKNPYLDNLVSMQSEEKLFVAYEVNHEKIEEAFIFTINMSNNRRAIIFENASNDASTATWVFVTKTDNYEQCVDLVFDYFTDDTFFLKRSSLHTKSINPPKKFKAESYTFIDHDDLGKWLKKLNIILEQTPKRLKLEFRPGLRLPKSSETRTGHKETIATHNLHKELMKKLYDKLCIENGADNVGTECFIGAKRVDVVVNGEKYYDIYEIKTADDPLDCYQQALGQLFVYAHLSGPDNIRKMTIVGPSEPTQEFELYLSEIRKNHSFQIYYLKA